MLEIQALETSASTDSNGQTAPAFAPRPSRSELVACGEQLRKKCHRRSHAAWKPPADRPDPVKLVEEGNRGRIPQLIPIRHGRMIQSPFTYYRGAALAMAVDLATLPTTGVRVQACGDAHLGNFRCFATPERRVIFDIHDLDETLPAPWEWDLKRLAASFVIACRNNGLSEKRAREAVLTCVRTYRERMIEFSEMRALQVWYYSLDANDLVESIEDAEIRGRAKKRLAKAKALTALEYDFPKLADTSSESPTIRDNPPLIYHWHEIGAEELDAVVHDAFARYRMSLPDDRRVLLDRYEFKDVTAKVVGVGSVGTWCAVGLFMAADDDPIFLQVKEATASVLEPYAGKSLHQNHGERVVAGQRLMQSASDMFLGWTRGPNRRDYYVRQLRDAKITAIIDDWDCTALRTYGRLCAWALARAHARSGDAARIAGYLGSNSSFDDAVCEFSVEYADQNQRDYRAFIKAVREGRIEVITET